MNIFDMRREYTKDGLHESQADAHPIAQFRKWFDQAVETNEGQFYEPNAMTLSTVTADGLPASRIVLLKDISDEGFTFFTNYKSNKGEQLAANPHASLCFWWSALERQVVIGGSVQAISREESEAYFATRPRESQLGAWASIQSEPIVSREVLEKKLDELAKDYADKPIPCPAYWGGYLLKPRMIEFWQGRPGRLHDRLSYTLQSDGQWKCQRLSP